MTAISETRGPLPSRLRRYAQGERNLGAPGPDRGPFRLRIAGVQRRPIRLTFFGLRAHSSADSTNRIGVAQYIVFNQECVRL